MNKTELDNLKLDLSLKAKNGFDFIMAATLIWIVIAFMGVMRMVLAVWIYSSCGLPESWTPKFCKFGSTLKRKRT